METQMMYGGSFNVLPVKGSPYEYTPEEQFINHLISIKMKTLENRIGPEHLDSDFILKITLQDSQGLTDELPYRTFKVSGIILYQN
jgi:hypothetical protein